MVELRRAAGHNVFMISTKRHSDCYKHAIVGQFLKYMYIGHIILRFIILSSSLS